MVKPCIIIENATYRREGDRVVPARGALGGTSEQGAAAIDGKPHAGQLEVFAQEKGTVRRDGGNGDFDQMIVSADPNVTRVRKDIRPGR